MKHINNIYETYSEFKSWIKNKIKEWILTKFIFEQSKIFIKWWIQTCDHTEINKNNHFQNNNFIKQKLSLLNAVLK